MPSSVCVSEMISCRCRASFIEALKDLMHVLGPMGAFALLSVGRTQLHALSNSTKTARSISIENRIYSRFVVPS